MRILKRILMGLGILLLLLLVVSFFLPSTVVIERSTLINAPTFMVFGEVNDFHNWAHWSPWIQKDPATVTTYSGAGQGVGAQMNWKSEVMGDGHMRIDSSEAGKSIGLQLVFEDFGNENRAAFAFTPAGGGTSVTWKTTIHLGWNPVAKYFGLFMPSMMGPDFEAGLENLRQHCEKIPKFAVGQQRLAATQYASMKRQVTAATLDAARTELSALVSDFVMKNKLGEGKPLFVRYTEWPGQTPVEIEVGCNVTKEFTPANGFTLGTTVDGPVFSVTISDPAQSAKAFAYMEKYIKARGLARKGPAFEFRYPQAGKPDQVEFIFPY